MSMHTSPFGGIITSSASKGGVGRPRRHNVEVSSVAVRRHDDMMPLWVQQLHPDDPTDYTKIPSGYLRELYPYVYYWGVKADLMLANLRIMNALRAEELLALSAVPGYNEYLIRGSFTEDLLVTYRATKLAQLLLREDVPKLMPYIQALHAANLFQIAYRNVSTAEVHEENLIHGLEQDTPLHDFYNRELGMYVPRAWAATQDTTFTDPNIAMIQSVFIRICLGEPIMEQVPVVAGDWAVHVAFCARWGLTP